jgi:hypothetical protein
MDYPGSGNHGGYKSTRFHSTRNEQFRDSRPIAEQFRDRVAEITDRIAVPLMDT